MITVSDLGLAYSGQPLFSHVDLQFTKGNCYGIIGANGAGKSTFLKILSGELEPTSGEVSILPKTRMSVLKQDQFQYDEYPVIGISGGICRGGIISGSYQSAVFLAGKKR